MNRYSPKDWSPLDEKQRHELKRFLKALDGKRYRGWTFEYEHPGYFVFFRPDSDVSVYFTPDWNTEGSIAIQVRNSGDFGADELAEVPFIVRTPENLFAAVKPWLDKYHPGRAIK